MTDDVSDHYSGHGNLANAILAGLLRAGIDEAEINTAHLASVDEFHIGGRKATIDLAAGLNLTARSSLLDIGSGLGGPARTVAENFSCHVTGIDLTPAFCEAAGRMSGWVGLGDRVVFKAADATALPFPNGSFDAAMTIHVAMNIAAKDRLYAEARRVLKTGSRFGVYDVLQGEGGDIHFPVPWARDPSISHLATPQATSQLLREAGFSIVEVCDTTEEGQHWFEEMAARIASNPPPVTFGLFLGEDFPAMAKNQVRNLRERRIRTVRFTCAAA